MIVIIRVIIHGGDNGRQADRRGHKGVMEMIFIWIEVCFEREPENTSKRRMSEEMLLYNH